ncbi:MAG: tetratricopeptide repeat protein [Comamonadaceae bacterium]|nr:tetratricopeptide repeat protein [Comamonadaceae bacterium]
MNPSPLLSRPLAAALLAACLPLAAQAQAHKEDAYASVTRLMEAGQLAEAQARADRHMAEHPRDPQMRFIQSTLLSRRGQHAEAEALLVQLTQDFPELAEPYNNLAVLYAARGDLPRAREALEHALRLSPGYATAHENLGDVYLRLAAQAYARAQAEGGHQARLAPKADAIVRLLPPAPPPPQPPGAARP